jgi:outer membrane protein assembly factor BamB
VLDQMTSASPPRRWTRRDFLRIAGLVGAGGLSLAALARLLESPPGPVSTAMADGTAAPSLSPGADLSALRTQYRSRPDLTPPTVIVNVPAAPEVGAGLIFMTPSNGDATDGPMIVDDSGELVWLRPDSGQRTTNLQVVDHLGQPTLLWWEGSVNGGIGSGEVILADSSYHEIARIQAGNGYPADLHECRITPQGTALLTGDAGVAATSALGGAGVAGQVMDCGIWEVDIPTGQVLFEWHGVDHVALDESFVAPTSDQSAIWDYLHVNSIEVDRDGGLLVSARNTSTVYKVDRATGRIVWRLGGKRSDFSIGGGAAFSWQHDARRHADGTISIFDDATDPSTSRAIFLDVDEQAMASTLVRAYARSEPVLAHSQGNAQLLPNGNVFVGWGDAPYCSEFSADGRTLFDAAYPAAKQSYRVFRMPWVGRPSDTPSIAVERGAGGALTVYASWNGATEVATWEVRAGSSSSAMTTVARAARAGFETPIAVAASAPLMAVDALDSAGRILGSSSSTPIGA